MSTRANKVVGIGLAVVLLAFMILLQAASSSEPTKPLDPSASNYNEPGRRAAYSLLKRLGFSVRTWQLPPSSLPRRGATLLLPVVPRSVFGRESSSDLPDSPLAAGAPSSLDVHLPVHYRRFLESGGVLITSASDEMLRFLANELQIEAVQDLVLRSVSSDSAPATLVGNREELEIRWIREFERLSELQAPVWAVDEDNVAHVLTLEVGQGELVLFADGDVFSNASLREGDEGLLLVRTIEEFDRSGEILFDEYSFGLWSPMSSTEFAFSGSFLQISVQFLLFVLFLVWRFSWIGPFPRDPEPLEQLSPVLRVRSGAQLLERARRYDLLGTWLVQGVLARASKLWRLRHRGRVDSEDLGVELDALGQRAGIDSVRWRSKLCEGRISSEKDLSVLQESLAQFEDEVIKSHSTRSAQEKVVTGQ